MKFYAVATLIALALVARPAQAGLDFSVVSSTGSSIAYDGSALGALTGNSLKVSDFSVPAVQLWASPAGC